MSEARVDLSQRDDLIGDVLRQKERLERVSAVLCDGLDDPAKWWRLLAVQTGWPAADRLRAIADLIEQENL